MASQKGRGFNDIFGTLTSTFKPVVEGAANVGASLATGLVTDLLSGKTPKASIKERGNQAKGMVAQRALQSLQGGRGDVSPSSMGWSDKTAKRKRSRSKSQPPAKRKRKSQTGGIYPPIHYPLGNYPGYDNVMMGRGIISKMRNRMEKDCKDWYERQQKGGRRPGKKRKPKKQTGAGKKRKPKKQKGAGKQTEAGKKRKPKKQKGAGKQTGAGKKRKPRKQTGAGKKRTGKKSKSRKQTGDGLWSGIKEIFE